MATIPTISELYTSIKQRLESELEVKISIFGKSYLIAIAAVQAAKMKLLWQYVATVSKNSWVDTADPVSSGGTLERFGLVKLGRPPQPATKGVYTVEVTGVIGATIPAGSQFSGNDDSAAPSYKFILDNAYQLVAATDSIQLRALTAGPESRLEVADKLTSSSPLLNVDDVVTVVSEDTTPVSEESLEDYRQAIIDSFQLEAQGGAATDYRIWSQDASGVREVYPYVKSGECAEIEVFVEADEGVDPKGIPTQAILDEVEDVIEFDPDDTRPLNERGRRPLGVHALYVEPITPLDVDITYEGTQGFDLNTQDSIENALSSEIRNIRPFVASADISINQNDLLEVNTIISIAQNLISSGQSFSGVTLTVDGNPVPVSFLFSGSNIPYFNSVTFN